MARKPKPKTQPITIALDIETTKAKFGERPTPICVCLYSDRPPINAQFWGVDCIEQSTAYLEATPRKGLVIAHNGGKFDFGFYQHDPGKLRVIGSRLLESSIGGHKTLDTFLLMPTSLKNLGAKWETDLDKHQLDANEEDRAKILDYCTQDCRVLLEAYRRFCLVFTGDEFTPCKETAAGNAFKELKNTRPNAAPSLWRTTGVYDALMRPFYHGGIVNTFGPARDIVGKYTMVDANSMYPGAMKNYPHPVSNRYVKVEMPKLTREGKLAKFGDKVFFIEFDGWSNILPFAGPKGLEYNVTGTYRVTSHELQAALRHGMVRIDRAAAAFVFIDNGSFSDFVDKFYALRQEKKRAGDPVEYVYKIVLNSAYGKFGQNPENYAVNESTDCKLTPEARDAHTEWVPTGYNAETSTYYWECSKILDEDDANFVNVATAASITGASRACLIDAVGAVVGAGGTVHYTDTDSIIFEGDATMDLGDELGQWKVEDTLQRLVIAAPKLYALERMTPKKGEAWKVASKGVRATAEQIINLVAGVEDLTYKPEVGSHDYKGKYRTVGRTIKRESLKR